MRDPEHPGAGMLWMLNPRVLLAAGALPFPRALWPCPVAVLDVPAPRIDSGWSPRLSMQLLCHSPDSARWRGERAARTSSAL